MKDAFYFVWLIIGFLVFTTLFIVLVFLIQLIPYIKEVITGLLEGIG